jgi:mycothiol synthase
VAQQLRMTWPYPKEIEVEEIPAGYFLRSFQNGDEEEYIRLLNSCELGKWDLQRLEAEMKVNPLAPEGIFFITGDDRIVATALASYRGAVGQNSNNQDLQNLVELGWVAVLPEERGKGLAKIICSRVIKFMLDKGYKNIYLLTDYWRLPALKTYLRLGFEPQIRDSDELCLWKKICEELGWDFSQLARAMDGKMI